MWLLLLTISAGAAPPTSTWARLATPPAPLGAVTAVGPDLVALTTQGTLLRLREGRWQELAGPTPTTERAAGLVTHEGRAWLYVEVPPVVQPWTDDGWGPREPVPVVGVTTLASSGGVLAAGGLHGTAALRVDGAWRPLEGIGQEHLAVRADRGSGLWWWDSGDGGRVRHTDLQGRVDEEGPGFDRWSLVAETLAVDASGRPVWGGVGVTRLVDGGEARGEGSSYVTAIAQGAELWAVSAASATADGEPRSVPVSFTQVGERPSGELWGLSDDGMLYGTRRGPGLDLRDASDAWKASALAAHASRAVDIDADGLTDLVVLAQECRSAVWLQRGGTLVEATDEVGLPRCAVDVAAGDIDGDGRADLAVQWGDADPSGRGLGLFRNVGGRLHDVTDRGLAGPQLTEANRWGRPQWVDLDDDGDLDLVLSAHGVPDAPQRAWLWVNDGLGRLRAVDLPKRGLAYEAYVGSVLRGDLDHDGLTDTVLTTYWGDGHKVLRGLPGGGVRDTSAIAGLRGVYANASMWELVDLDVDGHLDLLTGRGEAPTVFRGRGDGTFEGATDAMGLSSAGPQSALAIADLDGDAFVDLVGCGDDGCSVWTGSASGFLARHDQVPRARWRAGWITVLDLGGDGDDDLVLHRPDGAVVVESLRDLHDDLEAAAPPVVPFGWSRRLRWLDPRTDGVVLGGLLVLLLGLAVRARRAGSRLLLGRRDLPVAVGLGLGLGAVTLVDQTLGLRAGAAGVAAAALLVVGGVEPRWHRRRQATRVAGYRLHELLGRGGMGSVWLAREEASGARVALKLVDASLLETEEDLRLYREEARIGSEVDHPGVVRILGWGEWTAPDTERLARTAYLVMECIDGPTLGAWAAARRPVPVAAACGIVADICDALAAIHRLDVVHRDVKPSNIMLAPGGRVVLMDFGAARYVGQVTQHHRHVLGTVGYMAPEQGRGQAPDPGSDVYAAGVVLYELLAGRRPFEAENLMTLMARVLEESPPPIERDLPDGLEDLVHRCLAKDAADRPSAAAVASALRTWARPIDGGGAAEAVSPPTATATRTAGPRRG